MFLIDQEKSYLIGSECKLAGEPFEVEKSLGRRMLEANDSLFEYDPEADAEETTADDLNEVEDEGTEEKTEEAPQDATESPVPAPAVEDDPKDVEDTPIDTGARTAVYGGGGWYDLDGKSVRLKDIPEGVKIIRE